MPFPLTGMFFLRDRDEYYSTGQIIDSINDDYCLAEFDNQSGKQRLPLEVVGVEEMAHEENEEDAKCWRLFKTREERDAYLAWLSSPSQPASIISIVRKKPEVTPHADDQN